MDKPLYTIKPYEQGIDNWLLLTLVIFLISLSGAYYFNKNKSLDYNRRNIMVMILSFFALIAFMTSGFRLYSKWRLKPIEMYSNRIKTPYGSAPLSNVLDYYIKLEKRYKPMQTEVVKDSAFYFFLIERNNKTHVLSEGDYPIYEVLDNMNKLMKE